jgi:SulP family sulfate permease
MPQPVITGFTAGIAVIIFSSQVKDLLGLRMEKVPAEFLRKLAAVRQAIADTQPSRRSGWPSSASWLIAGLRRWRRPGQAS